MFRARKPKVRRAPRDDLSPRKRAKTSSPSTKAAPSPLSLKSSTKTDAVKSPTPRCSFELGPSQLPAHVVVTQKIDDGQKPHLSDESKHSDRPASSTSLPTKSEVHDKSCDVLCECSTKSVVIVQEVAGSSADIDTPQVGEDAAATILEAAEHAAVDEDVDEEDVSEHADADSQKVDCESLGADEADVSLEIEEENDTNAAAGMWPPYEHANDQVCEVHEHRLIKPENDPLIEAALNLL